jgi:hypothetical protein
MLFPSLSYAQATAGERASLARGMPGWLYPFRVIPRRHLPGKHATHSKQRPWSPFPELLSSLFHGKFFRCSQATENLRMQIDPRGLQDFSQMKEGNSP